MELNKFSEVSTSLVHDIEKNIIKKTYKKNTQIDLSINDLKELVDQYIYSLESSGISVPAIIDSYILDDELIYETEYCGKNIVELGLNTTNMKTYFSHIDAMMGIIKLAIKRMIPSGPLGKQQLSNCKIYRDSNHKHEAQNPRIIDIASMNKKNIVFTNRLKFIRNSYHTPIIWFSI